MGNARLRRSDHKLIREPKDPEALLSQPAVALFVSEALLWDFVARPIDFNNEPMFEIDEVDDVLAERNLPLKLCSLASSIPNGAPDDGFSSNSLRALFACKTKKQGFRNFSRHREGSIANFAC